MTKKICNLLDLVASGIRLRAFAAFAILCVAASAYAQTFAAIQFTPTQVPADNLQELGRLVREAARQGATAVVLPEHATAGPWPKDGSESEASQFWEMTSAQSMRLFAGLAKDLATWMVIPVPERAPDRQHVFIDALVFDHNGELVKRQPKLSPRLDRGDGSAGPGDIRILSSLEFPGVRIGVALGDDIRQSIPRLATCGAQVILISASWEASDVVRWRDVARELAAANNVSLIVSNLASPALPRELSSVVISKTGDIISEAAGNRNQVVLGTIPGSASRPDTPLGLPSLPYPTLALTTPSAIELGSKLFFDAKLSRDGRISCATCHDPNKQFTDARKVAQGVNGREGHRNTPTLWNSVFKTYFGWDGVSETMELQAQHALRGWSEMDMTPEEVVDYVRRTPAYARIIQESGNKEVTLDRIMGSLSAYIRTRVAAESAFDRYYFAGEKDAISPRAVHGLQLFQEKAKCATCHEIRSDYALFSDNFFHNTGVGFHKRFEYLGYSGDGLEGNTATKNRFRGEYVTPSLRNVSLTGPYMHDGSLATLADVVRFYNNGGNPNQFLDPKIKRLNLTQPEMDDLVEFLKTLNSTVPKQEISQLKGRKK